jgi:hypothetical protein
MQQGLLLLLQAPSKAAGRRRLLRLDNSHLLQLRRTRL